MACCLLAVWVLSAPPVAHGKDAAWRGQSLASALKRLQAQGVPVVFSTGLVRESMRVETEPRSASPRDILDEILRPNGLRVEEIAGRLVVVAAPPPASLPPPKAAPPEEPVSVVRDQVDVFRDAAAVSQEDLQGAHVVEAAEAQVWPHLGNDTLRSVGLLPGTSVSETSAQVHVRGGRDDEVLVVLDGLELLSPYHLQEFDSALSIVAPSSLDRIELSTGGYPAEYGDRTSGVIDMTTLTPPRGRRFNLGLGLLYGEASASSTVPGDRGRWFGAVRGGNYHLALEVNGRGEKPSYGDAFGKLELGLTPSQTLQINTLAAVDDFGLDAEDEFGREDGAPGGEHYRSRWGNQYVWMSHGAIVGSDRFVETLASFGRIDRDRDSSSFNEDGFSVRDVREMEVAGLKQVWQLQPGDRASYEAGADLRWLHADLDYRSQQARPRALSMLAPATPSSRQFQGSFNYAQTSTFVSTTLRPGAALTADLGARFDHIGSSHEDHFSPRLNLAWKPLDDTVFRFAWGWYFQSQRPNELRVEDGETELMRAERAEHLILGFEQRQDNGALLRVEAYRRRMTRQRARFENLYDPIVLFPELSGDRLRIAPESGLSQGIDLFLRGAPRGPWSWWLTYTYSSVVDEIAGREVPRAVDQPHALRADLSYQTAGGWTFNTAWTYHTGWPTTRLSAVAVPQADGTLAAVPVLGLYNDDRLGPYHRLDARVSHGWQLPIGRLDAYLDLQNLYDRKNVRGFDDFTFEIQPDGDVRVRADEVSWGGFLPSFGLRWQL